MTSILCLRVHCRVPIGIVKDDRIRSRQIHTETAGSCRENETEDALVRVEAFHQRLQAINKKEDEYRTWRCSIDVDPSRRKY
jgi:hypothetical protein